MRMEDKFQIQNRNTMKAAIFLSILALFSLGAPVSLDLAEHESSSKILMKQIFNVGNSERSTINDQSA